MTWTPASPARSRSSRAPRAASAPRRRGSSPPRARVSSCTTARGRARGRGAGGRAARRRRDRRGRHAGGRGRRAVRGRRRALRPHRQLRRQRRRLDRAAGARRRDDAGAVRAHIAVDLVGVFLTARAFLRVARAGQPRSCWSARGLSARRGTRLRGGSVGSHQGRARAEVASRTAGSCRRARVAGDAVARLDGAEMAAGALEEPARSTRDPHDGAAQGGDAGRRGEPDRAAGLGPGVGARHGAGRDGRRRHGGPAAASR